MRNLNIDTNYSFNKSETFHIHQSQFPHNIAAWVRFFKFLIPYSWNLENGRGGGSKPAEIFEISHSTLVKSRKWPKISQSTLVKIPHSTLVRLFQVRRDKNLTFSGSEGQKIDFFRTKLDFFRGGRDKTWLFQGRKGQNLTFLGAERTKLDFFRCERDKTWLFQGRKGQNLTFLGAEGTKLDFFSGGRDKTWLF